VIGRRSYSIRRPPNFARGESGCEFRGCEHVVQPHVRVPDGEGVAWFFLLMRMRSAPRIDIALGLHHLDGCARDVTSAEPDHSSNPPWHVRRIEPFSRRERVEVARDDVKRERVVLPLQLLLYSFEKSPQLTSALPLRPVREPRAKMQNEEPRISVREGDLEHCVPRSWQVSPVVLANRDVAQKPCRVRRSGAEGAEARKGGDTLDNFRISRLLQRDHVRLRGADNLSDLLRAADTAFANVVSEETQLIGLPLLEKNEIGLIHRDVANELHERCRRLEIHGPAHHFAQSLAQRTEGWRRERMCLAERH
jgi:hypothetical protein